MDIGDLVENPLPLFRKYIEASNLKQAKNLLLDLHLQSKSVQTSILDELAMATDDHLAWNLLNFLVHIEICHFNAFSPEIYNKMIQLITDRAHLNFEYAVILYRTEDHQKILQAAPLMKYILTNCTDREILFETIHAAGNAHINALVPCIAEFLYYDDATLKAHAVNTLGRVASSEARMLLKQASQTVKNDQQIMDTLEKLKESPSAQAQESSVSSPNISDRPHHEPGEDALLNAEKDASSPPPPAKEENATLAIMERLTSKRIEERFKAIGEYIDIASAHGNELTRNLKSEDEDLVINTLRIITFSSLDEMLPDIYALLNRQKLPPSIIYAAFETLCSFKKFSFTEVMLDAAQHPAIHVCMAAVMAINKNINDPVYAKIKNIIETGRKKGERLVQILIDAQADNIINYLLVSDTFSYMSANYLEKKVLPAAVEVYLDVLNKRGLRSTARKVAFKAKEVQKAQQPSLNATVISSSETVHRIYESTLYKNSYTPRCFTDPQQAFEALAMAKPDILIMDLFSRDMTALDLAREVRELYPQDDLPLLISTRQEAFVNMDFTTSPYRDLGINGIFKFPHLIKGINGLFK